MFCVLCGVCLGYHNTLNTKIDTINTLKEQQAQEVETRLNLLQKNKDLKEVNADLQEKITNLNNQIEELEKELEELPK